VLELAAIASTRCAVSPFPWAVVDGAIGSGADLAALRDSFPFEAMRPIEATRSDKSYRAMAAGLDRAFGRSLPPCWAELVADLRGEDLRKAIGAQTGLSLTGPPSEITLWQYDPGHFLTTHRDKETKQITFMVYLSSEAWSVEDGGCLSILDSPYGTRPLAQVAPRGGRAVTLVRTPRSWHSVGIHRRSEPRLVVQAVWGVVSGPTSYSHAV
jgi:hypothetical protein